MEAFGASVVEIEHSRFDNNKADEYVTGLSLSNPFVRNHVLDLYGFYLDSESGSLQGQFATVGARFAAALPTANPWNYTAEVASQFGVRPASSGAELDIGAFAGHADVGYTFKEAPWKPKVGVSYDYATGDSDRRDDESGTFRTPYTSSHAWYGRQDIIGLANIHNPRLCSKSEPTKSLGANLEYNAFWLADTRDYAYRANGLSTVRRTTPDGQDVRDVDASSQFGQELDLFVDYALTKDIRLHAGVSEFLAGDYLADTGAGSDAEYYYLQTTVTF